MSKLPNAPLVEVIFEIRWSLDLGNGYIFDEGIELAAGKLNSYLENDFPVFKRVVPQEIPLHMLTYKPVYQFWKSENKWPVIQLGPGIFTINCTEEAYDWEMDFRSLLIKGVEWLCDSYKKKLTINFASLRYIDSVKISTLSSEDLTLPKLIEENFNLSYKNDFNIRGKAKGIQINQVFEMPDNSNLQIEISDGLTNNQKSIIWQTSISKNDVFSTESLFSWADQAHEISHQLFEEMVKPKLYGTFAGK